MNKKVTNDNKSFFDKDMNYQSENIYEEKMAIMTFRLRLVLCEYR